MTIATIIPYDKALPEIPGRTPYTRPEQYLEKLGAGDYAVRQERRPSDMFLVNKLRSAVDQWRHGGYEGISDMSRRLMQFWFNEDHLLKDGSDFRYWWAQRESLETLIYLVEARDFQDIEPVIEEFGETPKYGLLDMPFQIETDMEGNRRLRRYVSEVQKDTIQGLPETNLLRYAFKMATGAGKTVVMAMAIVWSYFHRRFVPGSQQADNFLIVAPNVIVFERLEKDFASNTIFYDLPLIPPEWRAQWDMKVILRGESAQPGPRRNLFLVNIQQIYESREDDEWTPVNAVDEILGRPPKQDLAFYRSSMLERIKSLRDPMLQEGIITFLSRRIAQLATQEREIEFEERGFKLFQTDRFTWRRQRLECRRTVFNLVAVYNDLEARFARFLDGAPDIERFASLAEAHTRFRVDYLSTTGAIKFYYPDFVAIQRAQNGEVNWIIETKGREYEDVEHKDTSIRDWCQKISLQTGQVWHYLKVSQTVFDRHKWTTFGELAQRILRPAPEGVMFPER